MPTNTTSPSRSSRAARQTIISSGLQPRSVAIVHRRRELFAGLERGAALAHLGRVLGAVGDAVHPLVEPAREALAVLADVAPGDVEVVVAVVVALGERGVA